MDELIQRYLDGDLSDDDASRLTQALAQDPDLEAELQGFERMLALAARDTAREPSSGFTDEVMAHIESAGHSHPVTAPRAALHRTRSTFWQEFVRGTRGWGVRTAWAAGFALVFALGYLAARQDVPSRDGLEAPTTAAPGERVTGADAGALATAAPAASALRLVRLVYVPQDRDVDRVTVAGTFNAWDPEATTLKREGDVWIAQLVLPAESYEYMFIENGERWVTDPLAQHTRDDGFGRQNAVLDLSL